MRNFFSGFGTKRQHDYDSGTRMPKKPKKAGPLSDLIKKARRVVKRGERLAKEREAELARMEAFIRARREEQKGKERYSGYA